MYEKSFAAGERGKARRTVKSCAAWVMGVWLLASGCDDELVIRVTDTNDGTNESLRAAIARANASTGANVRIELAPGTYTLTKCGAVSDDDDDASGDLDLTTSVVVNIVGTGANVTVQQTCAGERILDAHGPGALALRDVTLTGGSPKGDGGAIRGQSVFLNGVTLTKNRASSDSSSRTANGGALAAVSLVAESVVISDNESVHSPPLDGLPSAPCEETELANAAQGGGVFVSGNASITHSQITNNVAERGGGVTVVGTLTLADTEVSRNVARQTVFFSYVGVNVNRVTSGGGIIADVVDAKRVTIADNATEVCGGVFGSTPMSYGAGIRGRIVQLADTTLSGNSGVVSVPYCNNRPYSMGRGAIISASERVELQRTTIVSGVPGNCWIATPDLQTDGSYTQSPDACANYCR